MEQTKVLIVEDEAISATSLHRAFRSYGYNVCEVASTGESAIEIARRERPDVILMDIGLAGRMDGFEAAMEIRALGDIPIVFLTGYMDDEIVTRVKVFRWAAMLVKPITPEEVRQAISAVFEGRNGDELPPCKVQGKRGKNGRLTGQGDA
jgi:CheY-like chemotaxis protein